MRHLTLITSSAIDWLTKGQVVDLRRLLTRLQVAIVGTGWLKVGPAGAN